MRSPEDGVLTLVLGGKSVGKSTVIRSVVANFTQAKRSQRTVVLTDMREMPADRFFRGCSEHSSAINGSFAVLFR